MRRGRALRTMRLPAVASAIVVAAGLAMGQWNLALNCQTYPSPEVADWENTPGIVNVTVTYSARVEAKALVRVRIVSDGRGDVATAWSDTLRFGGARTASIGNRDFMKLKNVTYNNQYREFITRTNRLMEGSYTMYATLFAVAGGQPQQMQERSARFYILSFRRPELVLPAELASVPTGFPTFQWTSATTRGGFSVGYELRICEVLPRQTPEQAIRSTPIHTARITNRTTYGYPNSARALEVGKEYVWQVKALDGQGHGLGDNMGESDLGRFSRDAIRFPRDDAKKINSPLTIVSHAYARDGLSPRYTVTLELRNTDQDRAITNVVLTSRNTGFQLTGEARVRSKGKGIPHAFTLDMDEDLGAWSKVRVRLPGKDWSIDPGQTVSLEYDVVPVLYNGTAVERAFGDTIELTYVVNGRDHRMHTADFQRSAGEPIAVDRGQCLAVTVPEKLFDLSPGTDAKLKVRSLLDTLGLWAYLHYGFVCYSKPFEVYAELQNLLKKGGAWCSPGALMIVGDRSVVPDWDSDGNVTVGTASEKAVHSDYCYAAPDGPATFPSYTVGRIPFAKVSDLAVPIRSSLLLTSSEYFQAARPYKRVLTVSGFDKTSQVDNHEIVIHNGAERLRGLGCAVDTFHEAWWETPWRVLHLGLVQLGEVACDTPNNNRMNNNYSIRARAAWLLDEWYRQRRPPLQGFALQFPPDAGDSLFTDMHGNQRRIPHNFQQSDIEDAEAKAIELDNERIGLPLVRKPLVTDYQNAALPYDWHKEKLFVRPYVGDSLSDALPGHDWLIWFGHGNPDLWGTFQVESKVEWKLADCRQRPAVFAFSCQTGSYWRAPSIALAFLLNGAGCYMGATVDVYDAINNAIADGGFTDLMNNHSPGQAFQRWKSGALLDGAQTAGGYLQALLDYNYYGDPLFRH